MAYNSDRLVLNTRDDEAQCKGLKQCLIKCCNVGLGIIIILAIFAFGVLCWLVLQPDKLATIEKATRNVDFQWKPEEYLWLGMAVGAILLCAACIYCLMQLRRCAKRLNNDSFETDSI